MADLIIKVVDLDGLDPDTPAYVAVTEPDYFVNDGFTMLHYVNGATQETTIIIDSVKPCDQGSDHNAGAAIPVSTNRMFGPFDPGRFNDQNGKVKINYTGGITNLAVAAIRVKP